MVFHAEISVRLERTEETYKGSESGLFFEFLRIWQLLDDASRVTIKVAAENVASMDESASDEKSGWMGVVNLTS